VSNSKTFAIGFILFAPAVTAAFLARGLTPQNAVAYLFMIVFLSITAGYVVASNWVQSFRPLHRNGKLVFPLALCLAAVSLGIACVGYQLTAIMSLGQFLDLVF
jgi:hypothetical protein